MLYTVRGNKKIPITEEDHLREKLQDALPGDNLATLKTKDATLKGQIAQLVEINRKKRQEAIASSRAIIGGVNTFESNPLSSFTAQDTSVMTNQSVVAHVGELSAVVELLCVVLSALGGDNLKRVLVYINKELDNVVE